MAVINSVIVLLFLSVFANGNEEGVSNKVLICSFDISSTNRDHMEAFTLETLDPNVCTHIIYNKAIVDKENHDIIPERILSESNEKEDDGILNATMKLKDANPQLKIILQICCTKASFWDNTTMPTSMIISKFTKNVVKYMKLHGFDGLYTNIGNDPEESQLMSALKEEFNKHGYELFVFLFPDEMPTMKGIQYTQEDMEPFDKVIVGNHWNIGEEETKIFSPLSTLRSSVTQLKNIGVPAEKLVIGIPSFSVGYVLCNYNDTGLSAEVCRGGDEGTSGAPPMVMLYYEIMYKINNASEGWVIQRDNATGMMYGHSKSLLWTSYEDPVSVRAKVLYALEENLAGVAIMTVDMDDFMGFNEEGVKFPLLRAAYEALHGN